jgi:preprotein translocase subunit SecA
VKGHWTDMAVAAALAAAGCAAIYAGLTRALRRVVAERQFNMERQLNALTTTVNALQARVAELGGANLSHEKSGEIEAITARAENMAGEESEQLRPEALAVITAAATTFLGKKARVRAARAAQAENGAGAWAQQGRVIVQTSHNLRPGA